MYIFYSLQKTNSMQIIFRFLMQIIKFNANILRGPAERAVDPVNELVPKMVDNYKKIRGAVKNLVGLNIELVTH